MHKIRESNNLCVFEAHNHWVIMIKKWNFVDNNRGLAGFTYTNYQRAEEYPFSWKAHTWSVQDVTDDNGKPGQDSANPKSIFDDHSICRYKLKYFDPSYGKKYNSPLDWENKAVAAYAKTGWVNVRENDPNLMFDFDHSGGAPENKVVNVLVHCIRKNEPNDNFAPARFGHADY